ncbi:hypothetical protein VKI21_02235 [Cyanobacterium aponinum UTEX 3222]|uniref:hypothetical protein n=1 Tax=Cyanobacterium aponinum TaxID=379064 RepID=UPI0030901920|nr:hypothetical protein VKI21_02235 [Cyanobacterium aponinum UTEX 3222]
MNLQSNHNPTIKQMKYLNLKDSVAVFFSHKFYKCIEQFEYKRDVLSYIEKHLNLKYLNKSLSTLYRYSQYDFINKFTWVNSIYDTVLDIPIYYLSQKLDIPYQQQLLVPYRPIKMTRELGVDKSIPKNLVKVCAMDWINHIKDCPLHEENVINKVRFEEFIIDEYQPSAIMVICIQGDDVCLTDYATNNGIPNLTCTQPLAPINS